MPAQLQYSDYVWDEFGALRQKDLTVGVAYDQAYLDQRYVDIDPAVRKLSQRRLEFLMDYVSPMFVTGVTEKRIFGTGGMSAPPTSLELVNCANYRLRRLLDYGCGTGRFVEAAEEQGWDAHGYDLVPPFDQMPAGPWDVVCFFDSLEHVPDPAGLIRSLSPAWLLVSVPECVFPDRPEWFMGWKHRRPGEHLHHWNRQSLPLFLASLGYRKIATSNFEDEYRPRYDPQLPNILTGIFQRTGDGNEFVS